MAIWWTYSSSGSETANSSDQLQARWSALVASLILGVTWATWHVPLTLMTGYFGETTFQPELEWWMPDIVFTAVITTWVYNNTR